MIFWACYLLGLVFVQTVNFCLEMSLGTIHLRRPHGRGRGVRLRWTHVDGVGGSSPMWMSTQKIKIRVHWRHPVFFSCKEVGVLYTRISSLDGIKEIFRRYKLVIKIINSSILNKLQSCSRISALGPEGHCTSCFKRVMCISCRPHVDVHKGVGGWLMWTGGSKIRFFCGCHRRMASYSSSS